MRLWWLLPIALTFATSSLAEIVTVRSGEHPGFSRLVAKIRPGAVWDVQRNRRSVRVSVSAPGLVFDTRTVFDRIPRKRLEEVVADPREAVLALSLGCDCQVRTFLQEGSYLVIDIADAAKAGAQRRLARLAADAGPYRFARWQFARREFALGEFVRSGPRERFGRQSSPKRKRVDGVALTFDPFPVMPKSAWRDRLIDRMKEIALRGELWEPDEFALVDGDMKRTGRDVQAPGEISSVPQRKESDQVRQAGVESAENLRISVAGMRDEGLLDAALKLDGTAGKSDLCAGEEFLRVAEWADGDKFSRAVAIRRSGLYGEFDSLNPEAGKGLAKAYLHFGFGAEAGRVLAMLPEADDEVRQLREIAKIMDALPKSGKVQDLQARFAAADCGDNVTFWQSLLADAPLGLDAGEKIARAFLALPVNLRAHLGPRVVRLLVSDNRLEPARIVSRSWERAVEGTASKAGPAFPFAGVISENGMEVAQEAIASRDVDVPETPYRLLDMIARHFQTRESLPESIPDLVASYALEFRRTDLGDALERAHAIALALNGRFDEALSIVARGGDDRHAPGGPGSREQPGEAGKAVEEGKVFMLLTENGDDITFLRHALTLASAERIELPVQVVAAISQRLKDLGFSEEAEAIAPSGPVPDT